MSADNSDQGKPGDIPPAESLIDAFLILLAGILFVLPGVITDVVGIVLIFPPSRSLVS